MIRPACLLAVYITAWEALAYELRLLAAGIAGWGS